MKRIKHFFIGSLKDIHELIVTGRFLEGSVFEILLLLHVFIFTFVQFGITDEEFIAEFVGRFWLFYIFSSVVLSAFAFAGYLVNKLIAKFF